MFPINISHILTFSSNWVSVILALMSLVPLITVTLRKIHQSIKSKQKFVTQKTVLEYTIAIVISIGIILAPTLLFSLGDQKPMSPSPGEQAWNDYLKSTQGIPAINDPLSNNNMGNGWSEGTSDSGEISFSHDAYHIRAFTQDSYAYGYETQKKVDNFAFQAKITMLPGNPSSGGILLGYGSTTLYVFAIDSKQTYEVDRINNDTSSIDILKTGASSAIRPGYNSNNLLAVLVNDNGTKLYINNQYIDDISVTHISGFVGFATKENDGPAEVMFQDAKLWV